MTTEALTALEEALLGAYSFPESLEEPEPFPFLPEWEDGEREGPLPPDSRPPDLLGAITERDFPDHEEQLFLIHAARRGREAARRLGEETGAGELSWRLWARKRLLGRDEGPPVPLKELPRELRLLREVLLEGERAFLETVERNLRLVVAVAKPYLTKVPWADVTSLVAEGTLGLMRAVDRFEPALGHRFSTYAYYWIRQAITRHLSRDHLVYLPEERRREAASGEGELAGLQAPLSLDEPLQEVEKPLGELLQGGEDPALEALRAWRQEKVLEVLRDIGPLHGLLLGLHTGVLGGTPLTLREVADLLDITVDRAERLHEEAKRRARHLFRVRGLEDLAVD